MFGPDLVVLEPHENFNVLSLSGKRRRGEKGEGRREGGRKGEEREGRRVESDIILSLSGKRREGGEREKCRDYDHYIQLLQLVSLRKRMH